ncbi:MAG: hypothetical protein IT582_08335 [Opitutaceae bacterium]|nr:hypothetical protein [Opitutaceae bacterium]
MGGARDLMVLIAVRGVLWWSVALAVAAFVLGTAVGAWLLARNPYNRIGYLDLVLPTRWGELRSKRGQALIDEGISEIKQRRYGAGIMLLAHGLRYEPANLAGRIMLGQMFASAGQLPRAMSFFRGGLPYADGQRRYVEMTFQLADFMEDDQLLLKLIDEAAAAQGAAQAALRKWLRARRAEAWVRMGRNQEVIDLWAAAGGDTSMRLNAARVRALAGLGREDEAMQLIEANPSAYGVFGEPWRLLLDIAKAANRPEVGRRAAQALGEVDPNDYGNFAEIAAYFLETGPSDEAARAVADFFNRFGLREEARLTLLKRMETVILAAHVSSDLVWARMVELGKPSVEAQMARVQLLLAHGRINEARAFYLATRREIEAGALKDKSWAEGTGYLLDVLTTRAPSAFSQLQSFCEARPMLPEAYRFLVRALAANAAPEQAAALAELARNRFPSIRGLPEIALPETEAVAVARAVAPAKTLTTNPEALAALEALNAALARSDWAEALAQIAKVENSPIAKDHVERLLYDRIRIHGHLSNQTEMSWYLRRLMKLPRGFAPARLRAQAVELRDAGRADSALTLLREILRVHPEAKWAGDLQEQWRGQLPGVPVNLGADDPAVAESGL